jgi:mannitol-specific phosphotransferase system IIBC component
MLKVIVKSFKGLADVVPIMVYPTKGILVTVAALTASLVTTDSVASYNRRLESHETLKQMQETTKQKQESTKQMQEQTKQMEIQSRRWFQFWK